jgi:hypothetical protein
LKDVLSKNGGKGRNRRVVPKSGAKIMPKGNAEWLFRHRDGKEILSRRRWRGKGMLAMREELCM